MAIIGDDDKQRFTLSQDGQLIRAAQGHSLPMDLGLPPTEPPEFLFHGTASANLDHIFREGPKSCSTRHVHLSTDPITAGAFVRRHGRAIVLKVRALQLHVDGQTFYLSDNGVWLTVGVPSAQMRCCRTAAERSSSCRNSG